MRINRVVACSLVIAGLAGTLGAWARNRPAASAAPATTPAPAIAEQADRVLKEVGAYIGSAQQFTFRADVTFDHVLPSGQKLQFSAAEEVVLQRPGRLYVEWNGDLGARQFWYDGKSVTHYDPAMPFYASEAAPPELDAMLDQLVPKLDFAPPLADFLYRDPCWVDHGASQMDIAENEKIVEPLVPTRDSEPDVLAASASTLPPGRYQLHWHAKSLADGDFSDGFIPFTVAR